MDAGKITPDFVPPNEPNAQDYPIDYRIEVKRGDTFFSLVSPRETRLVWPRSSWSIGYNVECDSLLVFQDQQEIPRGDLEYRLIAIHSHLL